MSTRSRCGTYTVTLTVTANDGATDTDTTTATIADTEPTADFSASLTSGQEPLTIAFIVNSTSHDGIIAWEWDFDNDGETDSTEQNPSYRYAKPDVYMVSLTVYESDGDCDTMTKVDYITVTKVNEPLVADPSGPYTGTEGVVIVYDGSGSYDPDGSIVAYDWDFGDGTTGTGVAPTHTYAQDGTYTVTLTVTDNDDETNMSTTTATIADTEPTADFATTLIRERRPFTVAFSDNSASYDEIETWEWDFDNDGATDSTEQNPTYEYAEEGVYTMSLTVYESDGDSDTMVKTDYITVTKVNNAPHTPAEPSPSDGATDVSIDDALSWMGGDPDDDDTVTYDVYFGMDTTPPLVAENQPGTTYDPCTLDYDTEYYWRIVATDNNGASSEGGVWVFTTVATPNDPPHKPVKRSLLKVRQMP